MVIYQSQSYEYGDEFGPSHEANIPSFQSKEGFNNNKDGEFEDISLADTSASSQSDRSSSSISTVSSNTDERIDSRNSINISSNASIFYGKSISSSSPQADSYSYLEGSCQKSKVDPEAKPAYTSEKKVKFHEPIVTVVKEVKRITLSDKCLLYYTDEDMFR